MDTQRQGPNGITAHQPEAIKRKYGPAFDARAEYFRGITRFPFVPTWLISRHMTVNAASSTSTSRFPGLLGSRSWGSWAKVLCRQARATVALSGPRSMRGTSIFRFV